MIEQKVPFFVIHSLFSTAKKVGIDIAALVAEKDFDLEQYLSGKVSPTIDEFNEIILAFLPFIDHGNIGLLIGNHLVFEHLPEFDAFITTAETPRAALKAIEMISSIINPYVEIRVQETDTEVIAFCHVNASWDDKLRSLYVEVIFSIIHRFGRLILAEDFEIKKIIFEQKLNDSLEYYHQQFGTVIEAGSTHSAMVFPQHILDLPLSKSLPEMHRETEKLLAAKIEFVQNNSNFKLEVLRLMQEENFLRGSVQDCAEHLDMTVRGLQRKLKESNTTYSEVQSEARMSLARDLLVENDLSIEEISDRLGFADRRSFTRMFSKFYGVSPTVYRKKMQL